MVKKKISINLESEFNPCTEKGNKKFTLSTMDKKYMEFIKIKTLQGLSLRSINDYNQNQGFLKTYLLEILGLEESTELKLQHINEYVSYMKFQKKLANNTINIRLRTVRAFLRWLHEEGYINNFHSKIKLLKTPIDTINPLSSSDIKRMLKACNLKEYVGLREYTIMIMILDTGIRINELLNITIDDINFNTKIVTVRAEISKTRLRRFLPISTKTSKLLQALVKLSKEYNTNYVFLDSFGSPVTYNAIRIRFSRLGKKAKIKVKCSPYVFRHTFATNFIKNGGDVFTLQKIMGHSDLSTTRKYIQLDTDTIQEFHNKADVLSNFI